MGRILLAMLVVGGVLVFLGIQEMRLAKAAKPEPQSITAADLIQSGPGDNAHVVLKDFILCDSFVYQSEKRDANRYQKVWVPVVPVGGEYHKQVIAMMESGSELPKSMPVPKDIRLLVKSGKTHTEQEVGDLAGQDTLQGVVINTIETLGGKEKKFLQESYPAVNFDKCLILEHGRAPATAAKSFGFIGGGALLSCLGVLGFVKTRKS